MGGLYVIFFLLLAFKALYKAENGVCVYGGSSARWKKLISAW